MKYFAVFLLFCLTGCTQKEPQNTFKLIDGETRGVIVPGHVGCAWKPYHFKTHLPLKGTMIVNILDCPIDKKFEPAFGYKTEYVLNSDNELMMEKNLPTRNILKPKSQVDQF